MELFLSVCKGKQLYSENNRFSGYWSNKFRKHHCNYLFYRKICIDGESLPKPPPKGGDVFPQRATQKQSSKL